MFIMIVVVQVGLILWWVGQVPFPRTGDRAFPERFFHGFMVNSELKSCHETRLARCHDLPYGAQGLFSPDTCKIRAWFKRKWSDKG